MVSINATIAYFLEKQDLEDESSDRFIHKSGPLRKQDSERFYENSEGYRIVYFYLYDKNTELYRIDREPYKVGSYLLPCAFATPVRFFGTLLFRAIQLAEVVLSVAFNVFQRFCDSEEGSSPTAGLFFLYTKESLVQQYEKLIELFKTVKNDANCALAMQISSVAGYYFSHLSEQELRITQMAIFFSEAELQWNGGGTIKDSLLTKVIQLWNDPDWRSGFFEKVGRIREEHNGVLSLYQCIYPLPKGYEKRIVFREKEFSSYREAVVDAENYRAGLEVEI